jgi:hypothetical protein
MTVYVLVNVLAMAGLMYQRLAGPEAAEALRAQIPVTAGTILGTTAVGVVLASLWTTQPVLVPFLLAPGRRSTSRPAARSGPPTSSSAPARSTSASCASSTAPRTGSCCWTAPAPCRCGTRRWSA